MRKRLTLCLITLLLVALVFSASIMILSVTACQRKHPSENGEENEIIESLKELYSEISDLPNKAFVNPCRAHCQRKVLLTEVCAVIWQVKVGAYEGAINKLENDIKEKIEKWIVNPWKSILIEKVDHIIELLEQLCHRDRKRPIIVTVLRYPETPNYDESVTVIAQVIDDESGVKSVILSYQVDPSGWINITMSKNDGLYVAEIPHQPYNSAVNYKVYAYDRAGNPATSKTYSYVVADSYSPVISYVDRDPASPNYNEDVTVFANVTEPPEASGVKNVTLWYRTDDDWQPVEMTLDQLYTGIIPAFHQRTTVQYRVRAFDYANNRAASGVYSYTVGAPPKLPPVAKFTESAETVDTGEVITFNATSSYDPDGTINSYVWDFGDGTGATGVTVNHAYSDDDKYIVNLTVTDDDGLTGTFISIKTVLNRPPVAYFTENATTVLTRETIHFDASSSNDPDGHIIVYIWNFSDGAIASGVSVSHTYEDNDAYTVTLTVIDDDGATSSYSAVETVLNRHPFANFSWSPDVAVVNQTVTFNASASYDLDGTIVSYHWNFGDDNITAVDNPIINHTYTKDGNYTVTLTVTDDDGAFSSVSATVSAKVTVKAAAVWPLALLAAIGLGIAALTATLLYALYRRRKKGKSAANPGNKVQPKPVVTLYVPAKILSQIEIKPLKLRTN